MSSNDEKKSKEKTGPTTQLLIWVVQEMAGIQRKHLHEVSGIPQSTLSEIKTGRQDVQTALLWRLMQAIAQIKPQSNMAGIVRIIKGEVSVYKQLKGKEKVKEFLGTCTAEELEFTLMSVTQKIFPRSIDLD